MEIWNVPLGDGDGKCDGFHMQIIVGVVKKKFA